MFKKSATHEKIQPDGWNRPKGYSNGILTQNGKTLYIAGQVGWDENEDILSTELVPQFEQVLKNIVTIVSKAGGLPEHICKMTCFCTDKEQYLTKRKELGKVWRSIMGNHYPCMSMIFVSDLVDKPALIEIEAIAVIPDTHHLVNFTITA